MALNCIGLALVILGLIILAAVWPPIIIIYIILLGWFLMAISE